MFICLLSFCQSHLQMQKLFIGHDALQKRDVNTDRSDVQMTCKPDANVCKICEAFGFRPTGCLSSFGGSAWWPEFVSHMAGKMKTAEALLCAGLCHRTGCRKTIKCASEAPPDPVKLCRDCDCLILSACTSVSSAQNAEILAVDPLTTAFRARRPRNISRYCLLELKA